MRPKSFALLTAAAVTGAMVSTATAQATTTGAHSCVAAAPAKAAASAKIAAAGAAARYKAAHDSQAGAVRAAASGAAAHAARKAALGCAGGSGPVLRAPATSSFAQPDLVRADTVLSYLNQQGQDTGYFCGPATVSEMSLTVPGPSNVDQWTAAAYMGTNANTGTDIASFVNGLNNYVGVPDYGWNFYGFVNVDYNPTDAQRGAFISNLQSDLGNGSPVAGDAWEVPGGPHLVGHPVNEEIFHYFEVGGYDAGSSQVYYADSATTVWSGVPAYSWYDAYTLETILGGRGYAW